MQYLLLTRCVVRTEERAAVYFVKLKLNREKQTLNPKMKAKDSEGMKEKMSGIFFSLLNLIFWKVVRSVVPNEHLRGRK